MIADDMKKSWTGYNSANRRRSTVKKKVTDKCGFCGDAYPPHLLSDFVSSSGRVQSCPICALRELNIIHELPEGTPFQGEVAAQMYEEAVQYKTGLRAGRRE